MTLLGVQPKTFWFSDLNSNHCTSIHNTRLFASAATLPYNLPITSQIDQSEERLQYMVLFSTRECLYAARPLHLGDGSFHPSLLDLSVCIFREFES